VGFEEGGSTVVSKISKILCHVGQEFSKEMSKRPDLDSYEEIREGQNNENLLEKEFKNEKLYCL
jgi:hypothetical protein